MAKDIITGIDVGTYGVKVVVAQKTQDKKQPLRIIGRGIAESRGLRHGYIINTQDAIRSIRQAIKQAEEAAGVEIDRAYVAIGGVGLDSVVTAGSSMINRADSEVTEEDVQASVDAAERTIPRSHSLNRRILHSVPLEHRLDGKPAYGGPVGLKGTRLETKALFITCFENHINDLVDVIEELGVSVADVLPSPIAASFVTLTKSQRIAGCVLANFGAETVSIVVYEDDKPISLQVFPMGSTDITNDIALGFQIPLEEAEKMKHQVQPRVGETQRKLDEIIEHRLITILDLIEAHLKKIGKNGLLPAGIVITGGGSGVGNVEDLARSVLNLPSRRASAVRHKHSEVVKDATWAVAYGLCIVGMSDDDGGSLSLKKVVQNARTTIQSIFKKILP